MKQPTFKRYKHTVIKLQRKIRQFLEFKRLKYAQFAEYLAMKSKKIMLNIKHFYKINSKFDSMRKFAPKSKQVNKEQKLWLAKVDSSVQYLETGQQKIKQRSFMHDQLSFQFHQKRTTNRWVQTSISRSRSRSHSPPENLNHQQKEKANS